MRSDANELFAGHSSGERGGSLGAAACDSPAGDPMAGPSRLGPSKLGPSSGGASKLGPIVFGGARLGPNAGSSTGPISDASASCVTGLPAASSTAAPEPHVAAGGRRLPGKLSQQAVVLADVGRAKGEALPLAAIDLGFQPQRLGFDPRVAGVVLHNDMARGVEGRGQLERRRLRVDDDAQQRLGDLLRPDFAAAVGHSQRERVFAVGGRVVAEAADVAARPPAARPTAANRRGPRGVGPSRFSRRTGPAGSAGRE